MDTSFLWKSFESLYILPRLAFYLLMQVLQFMEDANATLKISSSSRTARRDWHSKRSMMYASSVSAWRLPCGSA